MTQGTQSWAETLEPARHYRGLKFPVTSLLVLQSPARTIDSVMVCFGIQEMLGVPGEVVRCGCNEMESNYPTYLAPCPCHSSAGLNMSGCSQNMCRLISSSPCYISPCLVPVEHRKGNENNCSISVLLRPAC